MLQHGVERWGELARCIPSATSMLNNKDRRFIFAREEVCAGLWLNIPVTVPGLT